MVFKEPIYMILANIRDKTYFIKPIPMVGDPIRQNVPTMIKRGT